MTTYKEYLLEESIYSTQVAKIVTKNANKTTVRGGRVNVSFVRGNTIIAYIEDGGVMQHVFNASLTKSGQWKLGRTAMKGAPAEVIGNKKTFDDDLAGTAITALFKEV